MLMLILKKQLTHKFNKKHGAKDVLNNVLPCYFAFDTEVNLAFSLPQIALGTPTDL